MTTTIKKRAPMLWMLVKVPQITDVGSGVDKTAGSLRACIRDSHFGGEKAAVRRLTKTEVKALQFVDDNRARTCTADDTEEQP
ncbi:hypothetical protein [Variovorax sp. UMC13]|uniref:hypothetical protein n=1 Tax=Variovorax sp. UMC13 TaxID=1862326 RepID=UPI0015FF622D|nr:hypothetical protein [Variovorax sp. UMC13]